MPNPNAPVLDDRFRDAASAVASWCVRLGRSDVGCVRCMFCLGVIWLGSVLAIESPRIALPTAATFAGAAAVGLLTLALGVLRRRNSTKRWLAFLAIYATFLGGLTSVRATSTARIKDAYLEIRAGMDRAEVQAIVDRLPNRDEAARQPLRVFSGPDRLRIVEHSGGGDTMLDVDFRSGIVVGKRLGFQVW